MSEDLSPYRVAALRKWLRAANSRLLMVQTQRKQLTENAAAIKQQVEQLRPERVKRGRFLSRMVKSG